MIRPFSPAILALVFCAFLSVAQAPTRFDVASIKTNPDRSDPTMVVNPGGMIYTRVSLEDCLVEAYGIKPYQISGPDWVGRDHFDITAKADGSHGKDEVTRMLQTLMAERFKLAFHREQKELPVYALVVGKNGPKSHASEGDGLFSMGTAAGGIGFQRISMFDFAGRFLPSIPMIGRPVLDKTALPGRFDFTLSLRPSPNADPGAIKRAAVEEGFSLFSYALDQLGLRLESQKAVINFIVIDHVERPSEN
jgi:uncharacterized protein (TIGR03435 family)